MADSIDSLAVLVVDESEEVLSFFAKILNASGMRALLASKAEEALCIAKRGYLPIDLILTDVLLKPDPSKPDLVSGHDLVDSLRAIRPEVRALYMSASVESETVRIELIDCGLQTTSNSPDSNELIEAIRKGATAPHVQRMGSSSAAAAGQRYRIS
jgi:CheY-like chemotaxis protein